VVLRWCNGIKFVKMHMISHCNPLHIRITLPRKIHYTTSENAIELSENAKNPYAKRRKRIVEASAV